MKAAWVVALCVAAQLAHAQSSVTGPADQPVVVKTESPRTWAFEFKLGGYKPLIDREAALTGNPYDETFGAGAMLLGEVEMDKFLYQGWGTAGIGLSAGYAEKWANATVSSGGTSTPSSDRTGFFVVPLRLMAVYRFDYPAFHWNIPLVPYGKLGLVYTPWWTSKGAQTPEFVNGQRGAGAKTGYCIVGGLSFLLDVLEPRLARDFDVDVGVNHTYLFAEYVFEQVDNFGAGGLDLSSRHFMFGIAFDF